MVLSNSKKNSLARQEAITGTIFVLPFFIGYILFLFLPFLFSFVVSFTNLKFANTLDGVNFVGISNYTDAFQDPDVIHALLVSFNYSVLYVPLVILLGLAFALFINNKIYYRGIIRTALFLPYVSTLVAIAIVWSVILDKDSGVINMALKALGMHNPPTWLVNEKTALATVVLIVAWQNMGFFMVTFLAALQNVSKELYEACDIDGANPFSKFWNITWPMISPTTFYLMVIALIGSFQTFTQCQVLTQGGPGNATTTLPYNIYNQFFSYSKIGYANAQVVILFAIILLVTVLQWIGQKKWVNYV